ncbi:MAG: guanylate kinase [Candidatus Omnitrophota bacterium]|jgi:guanylate kinase
MNLAKVRAKADKGFVFVISGPSGSGKTTLARKIIKQSQLKGRFIKSISFTTRPKRRGERQGRDYFFVSAQEFKRLQRAKKILEHTQYLGYDYGTPRDFIQQAIRKGLNIILCLDIKGASFIKQAFPNRAITIFVKPPSLDIARKRIVSRCTKTRPEEINRRIRLAHKELDHIHHYDYYLINDNLNRAIKEVVRIIQWTISQ